MGAAKRFEAEDVDPSALGQPLHFEFSGRTAVNRFMKAAMSESIATWDVKDLSKRGLPTQQLINAYRRWGEANIGVVLTGNIQIKLDNVEGAGNAIIPSDAPFSGERFELYKTWATAAKQNNESLLVAQVSHPGRQVEDTIQPHPISASDVQLTVAVFGRTFAKPRPATQADIDDVVASFAHAAEYLDKAGWDGMEVHGAHGYLISQFLSPTTNLRTDKYGGSIQNRARIVVEIANKIRKVTKPSFILGIKLNSVEFQEKGFQPEEARQLCAILEQDAQLDFVELSGGTYESLAFEHKKDSTKKREAFFIEFAEAIAPALKKTKVYVTGGFKTAAAMVAALKGVDGIGLGRALTQEPQLAQDILSGRVKSSIEPAYGADDFQMSFMAASLHIRQLARDQQPLDLSKQENVDDLRQATMGLMAQLKDGTGDFQYGALDMLSAAPVPYGPPAATLKP